jgi:hypothetical protein
MFALVISALVGVSSASYAADWKAIGDFGWLGVGTAVEVEKGHYYWVGEFSGTFFSDKGEGGLFHLAGVKCPAWFDANYSTSSAKAGGYCIVTDLDGDQATVIWQQTSDPNAGKGGSGTFEYIAGTGKYQGISGKNTFFAVTQVNWADGKSSGYATWNK